MLVKFTSGIDKKDIYILASDVYLVVNNGPIIGESLIHTQRIIEGPKGPQLAAYRVIGTAEETAQAINNGLRGYDAMLQ